MISSQCIDVNVVIWKHAEFGRHTFIIKFCHCITHYDTSAVLLIRWIHPFTLEDLVKNYYLKVKPSSFMITSHEVTSEERVQKFHTNDRHYALPISVEDWSNWKQISLVAQPNQKNCYPDPGSDTLLLWYFWACSSDILWGDRPSGGIIAKCQLVS